MDKKVSIERIADALENIEDLTNELPEVDTEDAGKVLTVSETGEWEAATPSGGGGAFPVVTIDENFYSDKTYAECVALMEEGPVVVKWGASLGYLINAETGIETTPLVSTRNSTTLDVYVLTFREGYTQWGTNMMYVTLNYYD